MSLPQWAHFIHPKMTVEDAAREAEMRDLVLRVSWTKDGGLLVLAVPRETPSALPRGG